MNPYKIDNSQDNLFQSRLSSQLNPKHEMMLLSKLIPWSVLEKEFESVYDGSDFSKGGQPPKPVRLMIGLLMLQHIHDLSDEVVVGNWIENPYWQYFCGYDFLQWKAPIDPSSLTRFRNRIGSDKMNKILKSTIDVAVTTEFVRKNDLKSVIVDSTIMPKDIEYPTDSRLYEKARVRLVKLAKKNNIELRQNYNLVTKKLIRKLGGYLHAKQMNRANKLIKHLKVIVGRIQRDISRKIENNSNKKKKVELIKIFEPTLKQTTRLLSQQRKDKNKLYSLHEPEVICINKGKSHKRSEFGSKVSTVVTAKQGLIINNESLQGNSYDGHTLKPTLNKAEQITGIKIKEAAVDKGYRGHKINEEKDNIKIFISGQRKSLTKTIKKKIKRRQAIEPIIGHMKQDGKLDLCRLKGIQGNEINAILSGAGWNLRILLNHIRKIIKSGDLSLLHNAIILLWLNLNKKIIQILQKLMNSSAKNLRLGIC